MRRLRRWSRKEGFTLIEMMIAAVVFSVGMLGILKLLHISIVGNRFAKDMSAANAILQEQLEMVTREPFNNVVNGTAGGGTAFFDNGTNGDAVANDDIFTRQMAMNNKTFTVTLGEQADAPRAGMNTVSGTVSWTDMGGTGANTQQKTRTLTFMTYKNS